MKKMPKQNFLLCFFEKTENALSLSILAQPFSEALTSTGLLQLIEITEGWGRIKEIIFVSLV